MKVLNAESQNLGLIDLLSERHVQLRSLCDKSWSESNDIYISNSEWYIIARIYKKHPTVSYVSKHVDISRQAIHKCIKSLESKGLVGIKDAENNKKEKCLYLTELGDQCYETSQYQKSILENKIADQIGTEKLTLIKELLKLDWTV